MAGCSRAGGFDESVAQCAEGLVAGVAVWLVLVVEQPGAMALRSRGTHRSMASKKMSVADVASEHGPCFLPEAMVKGDVPAQLLRDLAFGAAVWVGPKLIEHPGAEHDTESGQGEVDVGVRARSNGAIRCRPRGH